MRSRTLALTVLWCALATGLAEVLLRAVQKFALHRTLYYGVQIVWMAPLADVAVFAIAGLLLAAPVWRWPHPAPPRAVATVMAFLGALSIALMQPYLHWWANLALSAGLGATVGRYAALHEARLVGAMRRTLPALIGAIVLAAAAVNVRAALVERSALADLPAAVPGAPNVLLLIWDTVRAANVGRHGYARPTTPRFDALAETGATFDRAIATASYTLPSHASIFTGRYPHQLRVSWQRPLETGPTTLAEALAVRGYRTGGFSANWVYVTREQGLQRGFAHFEDFAASPGEVLRSSSLVKSLLQVGALRRLVGYYDHPGRRSAPQITAAFLRWLDDGSKRERERPFFAFLNLFDAHEPYLPPTPYDTMFGWPSGAPRSRSRRFAADAIALKWRLAPEAAQHQRDLYDGAIAFLDHELGVLLDSLERRGVLRNTLVIVTSDHGEEFGEHRVFSHGNTVYPLSLHVPLAIAFPGRVPAGVRVRNTVSLRDLPATVGELLGLADAAWRFPGRSLGRLWQAEAASPGGALAEIDRLPIAEVPWYPVAEADIRTLVTDRYQLVMTGHALELFDLDADPEGRRDLARDPAGRALAAALADTLRLLRADAVPAKR